MKYTYDPIADAVNIIFKKGTVAKTQEVVPGIMIDFDKKGAPLYIEILDARKRFAGHTLQKARLASMRHSKKQIYELLPVK